MSVPMALLVLNYLAVCLHLLVQLTYYLNINHIDSFLLCSVDRQKYKDVRVERRLDLTDTIKDGARLFLLDEGIRRKLLLALTEDSKLHIQEVSL